MNQPLLQTNDVNLRVFTFIAFPLPLRKLTILISSCACFLRSNEFVTRLYHVSNILSSCKWPELLFPFILRAPIMKWDNNVIKSEAIPVKAVEAHRVVRRRGSHIF
jgi:hypothetical protein